MKNFTLVPGMNNSQKQLLYKLKETYKILDPFNKESSIDDLEELESCINYLHHNRFHLLDEKFDDWRVFISKSMSIMSAVFMYDILDKSKKQVNNVRITRSMSLIYLKQSFYYNNIAENITNKINEISLATIRKSARIAEIANC
tara:strand:- start:440 stop:871 length:432 start_codon:yes stop_codon:yes gene_type:complete